MSIEITKSAEETYRRVLHSLNVKYKGQEISLLLMMMTMVEVRSFMIWNETII